MAFYTIENNLKLIGNIISFLALSFLFPLQLKGQDQQIDEKIFASFDTIIGKSNSGIYNGLAYKNPYNIEQDKHQFFRSASFLNGSVQYDDAIYVDYPLKYDIFSDELLVLHEGISGRQTIQLFKEKVLNFKIENQTFQKDTTSSNLGFVEVLFKGKSTTLLKKHLKGILKKTEQEKSYFLFKNKFKYYFCFENECHEMKSIKILSNLFPDQKSKLTELKLENKNLRKKSFVAYFKAIVSGLDSVLPPKKNDNL